MNEARMSDLDSRRLAQTEFDRPLAVEAGAGTGKTTVLVSRILAWIVDRGWSSAASELEEDAAEVERSGELEARVAARVMSGVVAITFTEAAAAEMASRVSRSLAALATRPEERTIGFDPELLTGSLATAELADRARALVGALDHLRVHTIHAYCLNLLSRYPIEARVSPDLKVDAEGRELDEAARRLVESAAKEAYVDPDRHPMGRLALRGIGAEQIATILADLAAAGVEAQALEVDPFSSERSRRFLDRLGERVERLLHAASPLESVPRARKAGTVVRALSATLDLLHSVSATATRAGLDSFAADVQDLWDDGLLSHLVQWARLRLTKTEAKSIGHNTSELAAAADSALPTLRLALSLDVALSEAARTALVSLLRGIDNDLRSRGYVTYQGLLNEAWKLVTTHPEVRRRERQRIDQLLVDEFQDTDRMQCDLVRLLGLGDSADDRPGLFVVGDPKQSIYGWRNADLGAYDEFKESLRAGGGLICRLDRNFRSHSEVLREVDRAIEPIMIRKPGLQPAFHSLVAAAEPPALPADLAHVEYWISWQSDSIDPDHAKAATRADDAAKIEAAAIAADISRLNRQHGVPWTEFALLLRATTRLEVFLDALRQEGVPFAVTSDKLYYSRREIIDAAALVRTILSPVDHLALLTYLRSPAVGLPDAALLPLWRKRFPSLVTELDDPEGDELEQLRTMVGEVAASLPSDIPGIERISGWQLSLIAALEDLALLRKAIAEQPADRFIELLRTRCLTEVTEAARYLGIYRLANLDSFFRRLEQLLEERSGDLQAVLRSLRRRVAEAQEADQALPEGASEAGVRVMTIHGAKGLEFGHVYLAQLHAGSRAAARGTTRFDRRWLPGEEPHYSLLGAPTLRFDEVVERDREIDTAEQVRTLYVAMTRAKARLVLLGSWPAALSTDRNSGQTYVDLLASRPEIPESLEELWAQCLARGDSTIDIGPTRWRFPSLDSEASTPEQQPATQSSGEAGRDLVAESERLRMAQERARQHMNRPFGAIASAEGAVLAEASGPREGDDSRASESGIGRSVGTAFHRMMETWDLAAEPEGELRRQQRLQVEFLSGSCTPPHRDEAIDQFAALVARFEVGTLWERFIASRSRVVAREFPVVMPPRHSSQQPTGFVAGSIDLVLRDEQGDGFTVVDYKTDRVADEIGLAERARAYSLQEALYATALREGLELEATPRCELWFIWPDRVWESSGEADR